MSNYYLIRAGLIILLVFAIWLTGVLLHHQKTPRECLEIAIISLILNFCIKEYEIGIIPAVLISLIMMKAKNYIFTLVNSTL